MTKSVTPVVHLRTLPGSRQVFRFAAIFTLLFSLSACVVTPTEPTDGSSTVSPPPSEGISAAVDMYNTRNYPGAIREFGEISKSETASANDRRLAHLGAAMVYLGNDANWHSLENAKMSLVSAGQVVPDAYEEFNLETDLLYDAISSVIGTESKYVVLQSKSGSSGAEVTQLKQERDALEAERDELLAEQKNLNEALEKLKQLTLGN